MEIHTRRTAIDFHVVEEAKKPQDPIPTLSPPPCTVLKNPLAFSASSLLKGPPATC